MNEPLEQGFSCCAVVSAVAGALAHAYGPADEQAKDDPEGIYKKYLSAASSVPEEINVRLSARTDQTQSFYLGMVYGALLAGTILYTEKAEKHDAKKRKAIEWAIKTVVDILVSTPVAAGAAPALAIVVPIVNHLVEPLAKQVAELIVAKRHWMDVLQLSALTMQNHAIAVAAEEGTSDEVQHFLMGYQGLINVATSARALYEKDWGKDTKLAVAAQHHPHLYSFLESIFDHNLVPDFLKRATLGKQA